MYKPHNHCRACGYAKPGAQGIKSNTTDKLVEVFDLGIQPLANDFHPSDAESSGYAPLKLLYCPRCSLAQLSVVVDPSILYRHYSYVTSPSEMMRVHFLNLIVDIAKETGGKTVLEIGSNDGRLLAEMQADGYTVTGVDPAENLSALSNAAGVPTKTGFFTKEFADELSQYDIVIARHVFCHIHDWQDFVLGLESVSHQETLICIEVPYVKHTLENCEFDQVYHEHLSYLSLKAMNALLENTSLRVHRIIDYPIHGGAILLMLRHRDSAVSPVKGIDLTDNCTIDDWKQFAYKAHSQIAKLTSTVRCLRAAGNRIVGLGASAKSTVWISACQFTRKDIEFISDSTPQKLYTMSPGTDIPIVDEGAILREMPDYVIMFAWNYQQEILRKWEDARKQGVRFIIPVPEITIVN